MLVNLISCVILQGGLETFSAHFNMRGDGGKSFWYDFSCGAKKPMVPPLINDLNVIKPHALSVEADQIRDTLGNQRHWVGVALIQLLEV